MSGVVSDRVKADRFRAFWNRDDTDRPLIGATISTFPSVRAIRADGVLGPEDLDVGENLKELDEEWEAWREVSGDAIWCANPLWAFPWHLAMAGCPIEHDGDNLWGKPFVDDWAKLSQIEFDPRNPWTRRLADFVGAVAEHGRGRYPVGAGQLMLGPCDMMMQARGQERLALDLHDDPDRVAELARRCVDLCVDATKFQYSLTPSTPGLGGYSGTIRYFWAPGPLIETAEDVSFMMSPSAHTRLIAPMHRDVARQFPYTIVHLHSAQLHTVASLLEVEEIAAVQITPDFGEDMLQHVSTMGRILERKPLLVHGVMTVESAREMVGRLGTRGLALFFRCDSPAEAASILDGMGYN